MSESENSNSSDNKNKDLWNLLEDENDNLERQLEKAILAAKDVYKHNIGASNE